MKMLRSCKQFNSVPRNVQSICSYLCRTTTTSASASHTPVSDDVKPFKDIPGPKGLYSLPFLGTALLFKPFSKYGPGEMNHILRNLTNKYGNIFKIRLGKDYMVFVNHPDDAKTVMLANYDENIRMTFDMVQKMFERTGLTKSLIVLNGKEWAERRKPTQEKMLRPAVVATYVPMLEKVAHDFVQQLGQKGTVEDLQKDLFRYTTESVGMLCFNKRLGALEDDENPFASNIQKLFTILQKTFFMPVKTYMYFRTKLYNEYEAATLEFNEMTKNEIKLQREFLSRIEKEGKLDEYLEKEPNFMYSLLSDGRLNDDEINSTIADLFGAGIDSTANAMVFVITELAMNKDKQDALYEEIKRVVGDSPILKKEHIANMSYLKACVKESMRKNFPSSFGALRIPEEDLVVGGYLIPKGQVIGINMNTMATDARYFPRPMEFLPERWLRETTGDLAKGKQYPFATKPFSFGARSCIGQRFAENEIFIGVTKLIQNYEISVPPGFTEVKTVLKIFTGPAEKVPLIVKPRRKS